MGQCCARCWTDIELAGGLVALLDIRRLGIPEITSVSGMLPEGQSLLMGTPRSGGVLKGEHVEENGLELSRTPVSALV